MTVSYEVGQEMATMTDAERVAYSKGISLAYGAVFDAFTKAIQENSSAGGASAAAALMRVNKQWEAVVAAQVVRGVL